MHLQALITDVRHSPRSDGCFRDADSVGANVGPFSLPTEAPAADTVPRPDRAELPSRPATERSHLSGTNVPARFAPAFVTWNQGAESSAAKPQGIFIGS